MTVSVELGGVREKTPARLRERIGSGWSAWRQLTKRVDFLKPGQYQVAPGEGQEDPDEVLLYDVHSLIRGRGASINGIEHPPRIRSQSYPDLNAIFHFS